MKSFIILVRFLKQETIDSYFKLKLRDSIKIWHGILTKQLYEHNMYDVVLKVS